MTITTSHLSSIIGNLESMGWTTLRLEDVVIDLDIGAHDYEKGVKQPVRFDIEVLIEGADAPAPRLDEQQPAFIAPRNT